MSLKYDLQCGRLFNGDPNMILTYNNLNGNGRYTKKDCPLKLQIDVYIGMKKDGTTIIRSIVKTSTQVTPPHSGKVKIPGIDIKNGY